MEKGRQKRGIDGEGVNVYFMVIILNRINERVNSSPQNEYFLRAGRNKKFLYLEIKKVFITNIVEISR